MRLAAPPPAHPGSPSCSSPSTATHGARLPWATAHRAGAAPATGRAPAGAWPRWLESTTTVLSSNPLLIPLSMPPTRRCGSPRRRAPPPPPRTTGRGSAEHGSPGGGLGGRTPASRVVLLWSRPYLPSGALSLLSSFSPFSLFYPVSLCCWERGR